MTVTAASRRRWLLLPALGVAVLGLHVAALSLLAAGRIDDAPTASALPRPWRSVVLMPVPAVAERVPAPVPDAPLPPRTVRGRAAPAVAPPDVPAPPAPPCRRPWRSSRSGRPWRPLRQPGPSLIARPPSHLTASRCRCTPRGCRRSDAGAIDCSGAPRSAKRSCSGHSSPRRRYELRLEGRVAGCDVAGVGQPGHASMPPVWRRSALPCAAVAATARPRTSSARPARSPSPGRRTSYRCRRARRTG